MILQRIARLVGHHPRLVLAFWFLVIAAALPLAARVGTVLTAQPDTAPGSVAEEVASVLENEFANQEVYSVVLVSRGIEVGVGDPTFDRGYQEAVERLARLPGVNDIQRHDAVRGLGLISDDASYGVSLIGFEAVDLSAAKALTVRMREVLADISDIDFILSDGPATSEELERVSEQDARRAELFGLPLSLVILVIAFGAVVASGLPILTAITSIVMSFAILYVLGLAGAEFAVFTQSVVTMLGLATGIDYALLIVNRFREELRATPDPRAAAITTTLTAGKAVAFSGLTVMVALSALLVPPLAFIRSIGIGTIVVLASSVAVSLTAVPATLAVLGHRVNWLKVTRREPGQRSRSFWQRRARQVTLRPWAWTIGGVAVLVALSLPALGMQLADPGPRGLSERTDIRKTADALAGLGLEGLLKSFDLLIDFGEEGFYRPANVRAVSDLGRALETLSNVDNIYSPLNVRGVPRLFLYQYYASPETARQSELADLVEATVSREGRYALVRVFPPGSLTPREGNELAANIESLVADSGLSARLGGGYIHEVEWRRTLYASFPYAVAMVYLATLVLLGLAFRSLLIPIKSIVLNTLTVGAAYGVITLVFQEGFGARLVGLEAGIGFIDSSVPLFIFAVVFGLSMDYEVFLVARIFEAHRRGMSDRDAVVASIGATGGVITSAAAIMIVVFTIFIFSEVVFIKTLGLGLTVAILLDATLVRLALVPAVMGLAGTWNWWLPRPIAGLADRLDLGHD